MNMSSGSSDLAMLIGESFTPEMPFGENMEGSLANGYVVGEEIEYVPPTELGNGVQGPPQQQQLKVWRNSTPLAVDELGVEGPWVIPWVKVSQPVEGKTFPWNLEFGARFDRRMPGIPPETEPGGLLSPFPVVTWAANPTIVEVLPSTKGGTGEVVYSTAGAGI